MTESKRYQATGSEAEQQEGAESGVLKNLLGIKIKAELDQIENVALKQAEDFFFKKLVSRERRFTARDLYNMHKIWLGNIYAWAGTPRDVDLTKGIKFAHAKHIPDLMENFEKESLAKNTPCIFDSRKKVISALAEVHTELIVIHPFREGNGRLARVLSTLMALQAGLPPLDFAPIEKGKGRQKYFEAVRKGWVKKNYRLMEEIFEKIIEKTLSRSQGK